VSARSASLVMGKDGRVVRRVRPRCGLMRPRNSIGVDTSVRQPGESSFQAPLSIAAALEDGFSPL